MGTYTRAELVEAHGEALVIGAEATHAVMSRSIVPTQYHVYSFYDAPKSIRDVCSFNGGDEDWLVVSSLDDKTDDGHDLPYWIYAMDSCRDPDVYEFNEFTVYVGSHA